MSAEKSLTFDQQKITVEIQAPLGHDVGLELTQCSRSRIARVGEFRKILALALFVHSFEGGDRHYDLAAGFKIRRQSGLFESRWRDCKRHRAHSTHITGYVFADIAVAAGDGSGEAAIFIDQSQRHAIELEFAHILHFWLS